MQPNQNPYDFLNTPAPKRSFSATTQKGRMLQVLVIGGILLVIFSVVFSLVFGGDSGPKKPLVELAAAQADIIALTTSADTNLRDSSAHSKTTMIKFTVTTQNNETKTILKTYGVGKDLTKQIKPYQNSAYVEQLKKAAESNTYDATYQKILADKLGVYRAKLTNAYNAVKSTKQKTQLSDFYNQLETLAPSSATQ
jgi:hypothetical protein